MRLNRRLIKSQNESRRRVLSIPNTDPIQWQEDARNINAINNLISRPNNAMHSLERKTARVNYWKKPKASKNWKIPKVLKLNSKKSKSDIFYLLGNSLLPKEINFSSHLLN